MREKTVLTPFPNFMYDDNFDKRRHEGSAGFLSGITDFVQSIQDGLTLAQVRIP